MSTSELIHYDAAVREIALAHSIDEVKKIRDKAVGLEAYARQAMNLDLERMATEIRIRAERNTGEKLKELGRGTTGGNGSNQYKSNTVQRGPNSKSEYASAKESNGISDSQAKRWQKLAAVSDADFEDALDSPAIPTTNAILRAHQPPPTAEKPISQEVIWILGRLRDFEAHPALKSNIRSMVCEMTDGMRTDVKRTLPLVIGFFTELERIINKQ